MQTNSESKQAEQLLRIAVKENKLKEVREALAAGAALNRRDEYNCTVLMSLFHLSKGAGSRFHSMGRVTVLDGVVLREIIAVLIAAGADLSAKDGSGDNFLHKLAGYPSLMNSEALASMMTGVPQRIINQCNHAKKTPLICAAMNSAQDAHHLVDVVLTGHPDVNHVDSRGCSALHYAVNDPQKVKALIDGGADVNVLDKNGTSPLHQAALVNRLSSARLLIEAGADPEQRDLKNRAPFEVGEGKTSAYLHTEYERSLLNQSSRPANGPHPTKRIERRVREVQLGRRVKTN